MDKIKIFNETVEVHHEEDINNLPLECIYALASYFMGHGGSSFEGFAESAQSYEYFVGMMETSILKAAITALDDYPDIFDDFLKEYLGDKEPVDYGESIWPIILDEEEVIADGWHRFASYARKGHERIPIIIIGEKKRKLHHPVKPW